MDIHTLALAKQYTDSQRLGHTEEHKITWQGTVESYQNRVIYEEFGLKISDLTPAREALDGAKITFFSPGLDVESMTLSFPAENVVNETGVSLYYDDGGDIIVVLEMADGSAEPGVYWQSYAVIQTWLGSYIIVEYQTIHTIDPKYLPGVCLPVVEIADFNAITETESSAISAAAEKKMPCVFVNTNPAAYMAAVLVFAEGDGTQQYALPGAFAVIRDNATGLWAIGTATLGV